MPRIRAPQDLGAALIFLTVGLAGLVLGADLPGMRSGAQLGAGSMPRALSLLLLIFAAVMAVRAISVEGPGLVFGALVEALGYLPAAILTPFAAAAAVPSVRWREVVIVAVALGAGCALLFVVLLGQPLPLWWGAR
jgi:hypothetical protein